MIKYSGTNQMAASYVESRATTRDFSLLLMKENYILSLLTYRRSSSFSDANEGNDFGVVSPAGKIGASVNNPAAIVDSVFSALKVQSTFHSAIGITGALNAAVREFSRSRRSCHKFASRHPRILVS